MTSHHLTMWPVGQLIPCERQLRKNSHAVEKVAEAIRTFGFRVPILARSTGEVVDGHLRLKGAIAAGLADVPVLLADDLSEAQIRAFRISVNRLAELATWDEEILALELHELLAMDFPAELTGFDLDEINKLVASLATGDKDPDAVPPLPTVPVSRLGDLWLLGDHRLLCGDSTSPAAWPQLMGGELADCVWTDPPYNVNYQAKAGAIQNDNLSAKAFAELMRGVYDCLFAIMRPGAPIYVAHADTERLTVQGEFEGAGFHLSACLIWRKNTMVIGRSDYQWQHEPILYGWKPGAPHRWYGGRTKRSVQELDTSGPLRRDHDGSLQVEIDGQQIVITGQDVQVEGFASTVICEDKPLRNGDHPTMKPVALVERFLANSSRPGQIVADAFGGSGSTLMACELRHRQARIMELDPRFVDVIVRRWQEYTGQTAILAGAGLDFFAIEGQRLNG